MNILLMLVSVLFLHTTPGWLTNFDEAQQIAREKHLPILLNFSGSDWCGPCIRLKKEIFGSPDFTDYAANHLILVNADFPRNRKNKLPEAQVKQNESLADKFNPNGKFPLTLLLDEKGNILKVWDGFPGTGPDEFIKQIATYKDAVH